jgi:hypothetical protein
MTIQATRFTFRHIALAAVASVGLAGAAQAATTWNLASGTVSGVTVSGVTINGSNWSSSTVVNYGNNTAGGLGVVNGSEDSSKTGPHAADNYNGIDALVLSFTQQVSLTGFAIGWNGTDNPTTDCLASSWFWGCTSSVSYNDSDMSVYAWTGDPKKAPTSFAPSAAGSGWTLIGNYYDVGASNGIGTDTKQGGSAAIATNLSSSYWMISALGGGTCGDKGDGCVDAFKLLSVAGTVGVTPPPPPGVPEPGSLALLGLGALGLVAARRKSAARR